MPRRMGMKRSIYIIITIATLFTAVYFTLFNHPPAEETLIANRGQSKRRPEWMIEKIPIQAGDGPEKLSARENNTIEKLPKETNNVIENKKSPNRAIGDEVDKHNSQEKVETGQVKSDVKKGKEDFKNGIGRHGLKLFDWDKWIEENGFVSVGKIWAFCDEPDPPVVGAALLMADEQGGIKIVTVMNTTFENSILFGTIAVKVEYGGVKLYTNEFPACDMAEEDPFFTCPMKAGDQYYMREDHVPGLLPAGNYYTEAKLIDHNQKTVVCANCDLNIK